AQLGHERPVGRVARGRRVARDRRGSAAAGRLRSRHAGLSTRGRLARAAARAGHSTRRRLLRVRQLHRGPRPRSGTGLDARMDEVRTDLSRRARRMAGLLLVALAIAGAAACRAAAPAEPYVGLSATREQAAQAVVDAIEARDLAGLERLAVSSAEFRQ